MATFAKPENALKRAEELVNVGQKAAALQALHDLITSKRYRAWQKPLERIMLKYVELCVDLRKGRFAKDGLIQYRIACQQVNVQSLEEVVKHFIKLATERAEAAQAEVEAAAAETALGSVADLEAEKSPEDLMLACVGGEQGKERTDREAVTPWFKFLWEAYRTVLDVLRNNSKLEALYAMMCHRAFGFCQQYRRCNEFRRLCEILRNHLANLQKYRDQRDRPDLSIPESLQLYLETRFEQLKVATELQLWQEAFRSVEDIHGLMLLSSKAPKAQLMAVYYARLTHIFATATTDIDAASLPSTNSEGQELPPKTPLSGFSVGGSARLYLAYAWYKLYALQRSYNKNLKEKDLQLLASAVLLSALAVPPYERVPAAGAAGSGSAAGAGASKAVTRGVAAMLGTDAEVERERSSRMANLLGVVVDPRKDPREVLSRTALLQEIVSKGVMSFVFPQVRDLHHLLEMDFHPLDLARRTLPLLQRLPELSDHKMSAASPVPRIDLQAFTPALQRLAALRALQQASQVYEVVSISSVASLVPFGSSRVFVEQVVCEAVGHNFLRARINCNEGIVQFGGHDLESDSIHSHLASLARHLNKAVSLLRHPMPPATAPSLPSLTPAEAQEPTAAAAAASSLPLSAVPELQAAVEKEHRRALARKVLIERRKEEAEREVMEKEREEQTAKLMQQRLSEEAEAKRLAAESARREEERIRREMEARELEEARALLLEAEKRKGKKGKKNIEDTMKLDKRQLMEEALSEQMRGKAEAEKKLQRLVRTMDHLERAKREEERPLVEAAFESRQAAMRELFEAEQKAEQESSQLKHVADVAEKHRLAKMLEAKSEFEAVVNARRSEEVERVRKEREERIAEEREMRRAERLVLRKREMYRRVEEERVRKEREDEERRKREEEEEKRREREERLRKLEEQAERQRQREAELEEKARKQKEEALRGVERKSGGSFVPPGKRTAAAAAPPIGEEGQPAAAAAAAPPSAPAAPAAAASAAAGSEDRWTRSERPSAPASTAAAVGGGGGSKYVPPSQRRATGGGASDSTSGAQGDRDRERERGREGDSDRPPPFRAGGGGRFEPRRDGGGSGYGDRERGDWKGRGSDVPPGRPSEGERDREAAGRSKEAPREGGAGVSSAASSSSDGKWRPRSRS